MAGAPRLRAERWWAVPHTTVRQVAWSPDGHQLAVASDAGLDLYAVPTLSALAFTPGAASCVAFPGAGLVAWGGPGGLLRLAPVAELRSGPRVQAHDGAVTDVATGPAGRLLLASAGSDGVVRLWHAPAGGPVAGPARRTGRTPAVDAARVRPAGTLCTMDGPVHRLAFAPDGRLAVAAPGTVQLWDVPGRRLVWQAALGREAVVRGLAAHPGATWLAAAVSFPHPPAAGPARAPDAAAELWLWQLPGGRARRIPLSPGHQPVRDDLGPRTDVCWPAGGRTVLAAAGGGELVVHDWPGGELVGVLPRDGGVQAFALSPDGQYLAVADTSGLRVWLLRGARVVPLAHRRAPHDLSSAQESAAFSPDGRLLAVGYYDHQACLWSVAERRPVLLLDSDTQLDNSITDLSFGAAGLFVVGRDARRPRVWLADDGSEQSHRVGSPRTPPGAVAVQPDGFLLAVAYDEQIELWDLAEGARHAVLDMDGPWHVHQLAFSPEGAWLAAAGVRRLPAAPWAGYQIQVWRLADRRPHCRLRPGAQPTALAFHPGADLLAVAVRQVARRVDPGLRPTVSPAHGYAVELCPLPPGPDRHPVRLGDPDQAALFSEWSLPVSFSPDGQLVAHGNRIWRTSDATIAAQIPRAAGHPPAHWPSILRFSPDGSHVAVGHGRIEVWRLAVTRGTNPGYR